MALLLVRLPSMVGSFHSSEIIICDPKVAYECTKLVTLYKFVLNEYPNLVTWVKIVLIISLICNYYHCIFRCKIAGT